MAYSQVSSHRSMVFDEHRNALYAQAIRKCVTPDSVVLDLGAGLGILGLIAAAAGAKRVYLVEPEPVVRLATEIARANGLADRIVVLQGKIEEVELPEQVDVILSVFTGNLLYSEDLLPSLFHARDRYLKPGGKLIPDLAELVIAPVSAPELHEKYIGRWSDPIQGLDLSAGRRFAANEILWLNREELNAERLGSGLMLSNMDLMTASKADCHADARCRIEKAGFCHGLLGWIRIRLGEEWLSSDPVDPAVHWSPVMLPLDPPLTLQSGEEIAIGLQRPAHGDWTWSVKAETGTRRHSSFLARTDGLRRLQRMASDFRPGLGKQGERAKRILIMMGDGKSNHEIARELAGIEQTDGISMENALRFVQSFAARYGK